MLYRDPINLDIMQQDQTGSQSQPNYSQQSDSPLAQSFSNHNSRRSSYARHRMMPYPPSYHRLLTPPEDYATISQSSTGTESQRSTTSSRRSMMSISSIPTLRRQDATVGQG
ncbi:hypothetical protein B0T20DRAFT_151384 [Sordaria brevicollis]|uniref:Uncharacterized protein n=1 Tax=Sordaria brevicollis TaxID=83679 RepID=A0AAE0UE30_SORBR|nr:hypothetical protein B0T20DRAFT_151384 [Sordaria brevicollis]